MKKIFVVFVFVIVSLMISVVLAADEELSDDLEEFIKKVAEKKGIDESEIQNITEVNFSDTPDEVKLENIDDASLSIFEINQIENKSTFVITFSSESFQKISKPESSYTTSFLTFGLNKEDDKSSFMETASGVLGSLDSGYVMMRSGSITGVSTSLEITKAESEYVEIIIYKNGESINFGNVIPVSSEDHEKDYDIQSLNIVTFEPGDVISVYAKTNNNKIKDAITLIEITTEN